MVTQVKITTKAQKQVKKLPKEIIDSLQAWVKKVSEMGVKEVMKVGGYNMEKLKGNRKDEYSVRLNKSYRAIYTTESNGEVHILTIIEVNKHRY